MAMKMSGLMTVFRKLPKKDRNRLPRPYSAKTSVQEGNLQSKHWRRRRARCSDFVLRDRLRRQSGEEPVPEGG